MAVPAVCERKEVVMRQGIQTFRAPAVGLRLRQQVVATRRKPLSTRLTRLMGIVLLAAIVFVLSVSQFFHWQITQEMATVAQLQSVAQVKEQNHKALLDERTALRSEQHIAAVVGARLNMYRADLNKQVHHL